MRPLHTTAPAGPAGPAGSTGPTGSTGSTEPGEPTGPTAPTAQGAAATVPRTAADPSPHPRPADPSAPVRRTSAAPTARATRPPTATARAPRPRRRHGRRGAGDMPQRGRPTGGQHLRLGRLLDIDVRARIGSVDARVPRAEADAEFLGDEDQLPYAAERTGPRAGHGRRTPAAAVVTRAARTREQPADGQRPGHPHGYLGTVHHDTEGLDAGRDHGLQRIHGAMHITLPGVGKEAGSPDPATTLRATGFAPHRAPRSSPSPAASRTITRPACVPRVPPGQEKLDVADINQIDQLNVCIRQRSRRGLPVGRGLLRRGPAARRRRTRPRLRLPLRQPHHRRRLHDPARCLHRREQRGLHRAGPGISEAPRPVASAGCNFVRWFAVAAAPYFAPKIKEPERRHATRDDVTVVVN